MRVTAIVAAVFVFACQGAIAAIYDVISIEATWTAPDGSTQPQSICQNKISWDGVSPYAAPSGFRLVLDNQGTTFCYFPASTAVPIDPSVQAAISASASSIIALIPQPAGTVPSGGVANGSVGSAATYARSDATFKFIVQSTNVTLGSNCTWSATFAAQPFASGTPIVHAEPVLSSGATEPMTCIVTSRSTTVESGTCFQAQSTALSLSIVTSGITLMPFQANTCPAVPIQVIAREPTQ